MTEKQKAYNKQWQKDNPNYAREWRNNNRKKINEQARNRYPRVREYALNYYAKRNSKTEVKNLVNENLNALRQMTLDDLFIFQALHMKNSSPVSIGSFFFAIKQSLNIKNEN